MTLEFFLVPRTWKDMTGGASYRALSGRRREGINAWREYVLAAEQAGLLEWHAATLTWRCTALGESLCVSASEVVA